MSSPVFAESMRAGKGGVYMPVVIATPGESSDSVIKKFTRKVMSEGILIDANMKKFYVKKGLRRKMKAIAKRKRFI